MDEEAIRLIEEHNPDIEFNWTRILKGQDVPEAAPSPEPERRAPRPRQKDAPPAPAPVFVATPEPLEPAPSIPGLTSVEAEPEGATAPPSLEVETAALARLGAEGLLRLRARYSEVLARISEKITDPVRRDQLKSDAERLNPDTWVTDGDVTAGLEQYEAVFESLRSVVGRRRKRRKRRGGGQTESAPAEGAADVDADDEPTSADEPGDPDENI